LVKRSASFREWKDDDIVEEDGEEDGKRGNHQQQEEEEGTMNSGHASPQRSQRFASPFSEEWSAQGDVPVDNPDSPFSLMFVEERQPFLENQGSDSKDEEEDEENGDDEETMVRKLQEDADDLEDDFDFHEAKYVSERDLKQRSFLRSHGLSKQRLKGTFAYIKNLAHHTLTSHSGTRVPHWVLSSFLWREDEHALGLYSNVKRVSVKGQIEGELLLSNFYIYFHPRKISKDAAGAEIMDETTIPVGETETIRLSVFKMKEIYGRRYLHQPLALEFFFIDSSSPLLVVFKS
jgi:hypothetical protein